MFRLSNQNLNHHRENSRSVRKTRECREKFVDGWVQKKNWTILSWGGWWQASHHWDLGSITGNSIWYLWGQSGTGAGLSASTSLPPSKLSFHNWSILLPNVIFPSTQHTSFCVFSTCFDLRRSSAGATNYLVLRVPGYESRGPGFDSRRYHIFWEVVGLERGPLSLVNITEELLEWKSSGSWSRKSRVTAVGIRYSDHATPSIRKSWH
jgi:hypothetical protein